MVWLSFLLFTVGGAVASIYGLAGPALQEQLAAVEAVPTRDGHLERVRNALQPLLQHPLENRFELYGILLPAIRDQGFQAVRIQLNGDDHVGLTAFRKSTGDGKPEVWGFELRDSAWHTQDSPLTPRMFSSGIGRFTFDKFVIVVPEEISADQHASLSRYYLSMPLVVLTPDVLSEVVLGSKGALEKLQVPLDPLVASPEVFSRYEYHQRATVSLDVVHQLSPPFSVDFVDGTDVPTKAFNEHEFRLLLLLGNHSDEPLTIHSLKARTVAYESRPRRFVRIHRPLGIFDPVEISFQPSPRPAGEVLLLERELWQLNAGDVESRVLTLTENPTPGLYRFFIEATGLLKGKRVVRRSPSINLNVRAVDSDYIPLGVSMPPTGPRVESGVTYLLTLSDSEWTRLREEIETFDYASLGPTFHQHLHKDPDENWYVRGGNYKERIDFGDFAGLEPDHENDRILLDLGREIYPPYTWNHSRLELYEEQWGDMILLQMDRRLGLHELGSAQDGEPTGGRREQPVPRDVAK